jgi:hypothetical protein
MFKPVSTRRSPRKAVAAKVAGIIGVGICILIIVAVWFGLGTVSRAVDDLGTDVNSGFDRAITATDAVATRLDETVAAIDALRADAAALAPAAPPDPAGLSSLRPVWGRSRPLSRGARPLRRGQRDRGRRLVVAPAGRTDHSRNESS